MRLPEVKTPKFLTDLVRDLRDRRLLPLVAVLVVAIVAVPIALSKSAAQPPSTAGKSSLLGAALAAKASHLTAVPDAPGLRDYHRRLRGRHATNPFTPPPSAAPPQSESASTQSSVAESSSSASVTSSSGSATENGSTTSGEAPSSVHPETKYYSHAIDVRVVNVASASSKAAATKSEPIVRHNLPALTKLPGDKTPAAVFLGTSSSGTKAVLLISSNVQALAGKSRCVLGAPGVCQLLELEPGSPETFVYGPNGRTFRIMLLKVHLVVTTHPPH
jgi:hypothetical protein